MFKKLMIKIKRKENKFYNILYRFLFSLRNFNIPLIKFIHLPLFYLIEFIKSVIIFLKRKFYDEPVFKAKCEKVGKGLYLPDGIPLIIGDLKIYIGDNVKISRSTLGATHVFDDPTLYIGNNTSIGYGTTISVAKEVKIGKHVLIAPNCYITDSIDHPVSPQKRLLYEAVSKEDVDSVILGDNSWLGYNTVVLKGVSIGENSIVGANSTVSNLIPANCVAMGYPARIVRRNIDLLDSDQL